MKLNSIKLNIVLLAVILIVTLINCKLKFDACFEIHNNSESDISVNIETDNDSASSSTKTISAGNFEVFYLYDLKSDERKIAASDVTILVTKLNDDSEYQKTGIIGETDWVIKINFPQDFE